MNSTPSPSDLQMETGPIRLPVHGTTVTAEDLRIRLVLSADFEGRTEVDASEVESVGQAVLQLLVAARREATEAGKPFSINNPSPAFVQRAVASRLADAIGVVTEKGSFQ
jgi:anti-anti-sigma regulatory factor